MNNQPNVYYWLVDVIGYNYSSLPVRGEEIEQAVNWINKASLMVVCYNHL